MIPAKMDAQIRISTEIQTSALCSVYFISPHIKEVDIYTLSQNPSLLTQPVLSTFNGVYFNNQSGLVSKKANLKTGAYLVIPTTY